MATHTAVAAHDDRQGLRHTVEFRDTGKPHPHVDIFEARQRAVEQSGHGKQFPAHDDRGAAPRHYRIVRENVPLTVSREKEK